MRLCHAMLATSAVLFYALTATAADEPRYSLQGRTLFVDREGARDAIPVECEQTFGLARKGDQLFVACGNQGVALFSLADPARPVAAGQIPPTGGPCIGFTPTGFCVVPQPSIAPPPSDGRPRSIEGYEELRRQLKEELKEAKRSGDDAHVEDVKRRIATLNAQYSEDTERRSDGAFVGGFVMIGLGGVSFVAGLITMFAGAMAQFCFSLYGGGCARNPQAETVVAVGGVMTVAGLVVGLVGIPVMLSGSGKVMKGAWLGPDAPTKAATASTSRISVSVGPLGFGVGGTF